MRAKSPSRPEVTFRAWFRKRSPGGRVKGRAQLAIRLETLTLASGKVYKFAPQVSAVDAGETGHKVVGAENSIEQAPGRGQDA